jgi:hypothetical protein
LCLAAACAASLAFATPEVDRAVAWLQSQPQPGGSLAGEVASIATPLQSRAEALVALQQLATAPTAVADLISQEADSATEYSARKVIALAPLGRDVSASLTAVLSAQNADGGLGPAPGYSSDVLDTSYALLARAVSATSPRHKRSMDRSASTSSRRFSSRQWRFSPSMCSHRALRSPPRFSRPRRISRTHRLPAHIPPHWKTPWRRSLSPVPRATLRHLAERNRH